MTCRAPRAHRVEQALKRKKPSRAERVRRCQQAMREPPPVSSCNAAPQLQRTATLHIAQRVVIHCRHTASMTRGACAVRQLVTQGPCASSCVGPSSKERPREERNVTPCIVPERSRQAFSFRWAGRFELGHAASGVRAEKPRRSAWGGQFSPNSRDNELRACGLLCSV